MIFDLFLDKGDETKKKKKGLTTKKAPYLSEDAFA